MKETDAESLIKAEKKDKVDAQVVKCTEVLREVLVVLTNHKDILEIDKQEEYQEATTIDMLKLFKVSGLTIAEIEWTMNRLAEFFTLVQTTTLNSIEISQNKALEKTFGKEFKAMNLDDLDEILVDKTE